MTKEHNNFMVITPKDWDNASQEQRSWYLFNTMQSIENRLIVIEGRSLYHQLESFCGGIIGGIATMLSFKWIGK